MARISHAFDLRAFRFSAVALFSFALFGCSQIDSVLPDSMSRTQKGVATGATIGAVGGLIVGSTSGDAGAGAAIGAAAGAVAGGLVGNEFEKQDAQYAQREEVITRQSATIADQNRQIQELREGVQDGGASGGNWGGASAPNSGPMAEEDLMAPTARFQMNEKMGASTAPVNGSLGAVGGAGGQELGDEYPIQGAVPSEKPVVLSQSELPSARQAGTPNQSAGVSPQFLDPAENTERYEIPAHNRPSMELAAEGNLSGDSSEYRGSSEAAPVLAGVAARRAQERAQARNSVRGRLGMPRDTLFIEDEVPIAAPAPTLAPALAPIQTASLDTSMRSENSMALPSAAGTSAPVSALANGPAVPARTSRRSGSTRYINPGKSKASGTIGVSGMGGVSKMGSASTGSTTVASAGLGAPELPVAKSKAPTTLPAASVAAPAPALSNSIIEPDIRTPTPQGMKIAKASPSPKAKPYRPEEKEPKKMVKKAKETKPAPVKKAPKKDTPAKKTPVKATKDDAIPVVSIVESVDTEEALIPKDSNCLEGESEAERARNASSLADKVFYYRRALRLCPKEPVYRIEMGRVFAELGKEEEARFEFTKALELDPENEIAQDELSMLMLENSSNLY